MSGRWSTQWQHGDMPPRIMKMMKVGNQKKLMRQMEQTQGRGVLPF